MFTNSYVAAKLDRERQHQMLAQAERRGLARRFHAQPRTAKAVEQPRRRLRRALRAVFT